MRKMHTIIVTLYKLDSEAYRRLHSCYGRFPIFCDALKEAAQADSASMPFPVSAPTLRMSMTFEHANYSELPRVRPDDLPGVSGSGADAGQ